MPIIVDTVSADRTKNQLSAQGARCVCPTLFPREQTPVHLCQARASATSSPPVSWGNRRLGKAFLVSFRFGFPRFEKAERGLRCVRFSNLFSSAWHSAADRVHFGFRFSKPFLTGSARNSFPFVQRRGAVVPTAVAA